MRLTEYLRAHGREALLEEWDYDANVGVDPSECSPFSKVRAAWVCRKGHRWEAMLSARAVRGTGCPFCAGLKPIKGETDLASVAPGIARLWHPTRNGALTPDKVMAGSHRKVWWKCERGHEWQAMIYSLSGGTGCPWCSGKLPIPGETDLGTTHPALAKEWDSEKNLPLKITEVSQGTEKNVWWRCPQGHSYHSRVFSRVAGIGCPYCSGKKVLAGFNDLATTHKELVEQWYQPLNGALTPQDVTRGSHKKVWWKCGAGHVWQAAVYARAREKSSECPVCLGRTRAKRSAAAQTSDTVTVPG